MIERGIHAQIPCSNLRDMDPVIMGRCGETWEFERERDEIEKEIRIGSGLLFCERGSLFYLVMEETVESATGLYS